MSKEEDLRNLSTVRIEHEITIDGVTHRLSHGPGWAINCKFCLKWNKKLEAQGA